MKGSKIIHIRHLPFGKQVLFGAWTSLAHTSITEIFASSGFNFIGIDLEHSTISLEDARRVIADAQAGGSACLPRVVSHNAEQIRRLLDAGADGVIIPNVATRSQVDQIVEWVKYPPEGGRGYGIARAQGYGFDFEEYYRTWNERSNLIIQIESIQAIEVAEDLLSHEKVNGVMLGPYDLSGSLGIPGKINHPRVVEACSHVVQICQRLQKGCGTQIIDPTSENVQMAIDQGYNFLVLASDVFLLWKWGERMKGVMSKAREAGIKKS